MHQLQELHMRLDICKIELEGVGILCSSTLFFQFLNSITSIPFWSKNSL